MTTAPNDEREELIKNILEMELQGAKDPAFFISNFLYTFDPRRTPSRIKFELFDYQVGFIRELCKAIDEGYDIFIDKSRDMGATYTVLATFIWYWRYREASFLLGSRKEDFVDNRGSAKGEGSNKEESLFGKLEYLIMNSDVPSLIQPQGFDPKKHMPSMTMINPENGNIISGESTNPNFSRGGRFKAILMDEFAFWDFDADAWGSTADTTNCRIVLTTPGSRPNTKAYRLRYGKDGEKIKIIRLHWKLDPRKDAAWLEKEKSRRSKEDFAREIDLNWEVSVKGRVYADEMINVRSGKFQYNPFAPKLVSWDFGLDGVAFQCWQIDMTTGRPRLMESYRNKNKPIQFYYPFFRDTIEPEFDYSEEELKLMVRTRPFRMATHFGDPDVKKRSMQTREMKSNADLLREDCRIYINTKPDAREFYIRRDRTKLFLAGGVDYNQTKENEIWFWNMKNARYPERADSSQSTTPITAPVHDDTSHDRTATEYLAVNIDLKRILERTGTQSTGATVGKTPNLDPY